MLRGRCASAAIRARRTRPFLASPDPEGAGRGADRESGYGTERLPSSNQLLPAHRKHQAECETGRTCEGGCSVSPSTKSWSLGLLLSLEPGRNALGFSHG